MLVNSILRQTFQDFWYGGSWKILSIAAKGWFLFFIFPRLPEGALGEYVYLSTIGLICGRVLALGMEEQIPLIVQGQSKAASQWKLVYALYLAGGIITAILLVAAKVSFTLLIFLIGCFAAHNILSGVVRSVRPQALELLANLHPIVFAIVVTMSLPVTGADLALVLTLSLLVSQLVVLRSVSNILSLKGSRLPSRRQFISAIRGGSVKLASNLSLMLALRGLVLWPRLIYDRLPSDALGFAVAFGEAVWQLGMVLVNRSYARFCAPHRSFEADFSEALGRSVVIFLFTLFVATGVFFVAPVITPTLRLDWSQIAWLVPTYGALCSILLFRYVLWAREGSARRIGALFLMWFAGQGAAIGTLTENLWAPSVTVLACIAALLTAATLNRRRRALAKRAIGA